MSKSRGQTTMRKSVRMATGRINKRPLRPTDNKTKGTNNFKMGGLIFFAGNEAIFSPRKSRKLKGYMRNNKGKKVA